MYTDDSKGKLFFLISDIVALVIAYAYLAGFYHYSFLSSKFFAVIFGILIVGFGILTDEYTDVLNRGFLKEAKMSLLYGIKIFVLFSLVLMLGKFRYIGDIARISYRFLLAVLLVSSVLVYLGRCLIKVLLKNRTSEIKKVLLLTNFKNDQLLEKELEKHHYQVGAYISKNLNVQTDYTVIKDETELRDFIANNSIDEIFVDIDSKVDYYQELRYIKLLGIPITVSLGDYSDYYVGDSVLKKMDNLTLVTTAITIVKFRQVVLKRLMDIAISLIGIVLMGLVMLIIAPIVKKQSPGPLFFKQKRVGRNGKIFEIYKFRSMYTDAEERKKELMAQNELDTTLMFKMDDDPRIFPFGHKIRDWSIDELPQFINVLKGDMSVVGTRPPTVDEYKNYEIHHFKRLAAKPGITGLWQVSGRSNITDFEEVVALDMKYIQNWSISQDIKIIAKTFAVVLKREGSK